MRATDRNDAFDRRCIRPAVHSTGDAFDRQGSWEGRHRMIRTVIEEAMALVSVALFVAMIGAWASVLSSGW
jgi:hypothetical protein